MSTKDSLGDRMKGFYEARSKTYLARRTPVILRLDGKAFHTFTRGCVKPFDERLQGAMEATARFLLENIQGVKLAYTQSDEITLLLTDYDRLETDAWFDYNVQKMCSIAASMAGVKFTLEYADDDTHLCDVDPAYFDCRAFNIPKEEVSNCFYWRCLDWERNSVQMLAQAHYSAKQLHGVSCAMAKDMLICQKNINWNELADKWKYGSFIQRDEFGDVSISSVNLKNDRSWIDELVNRGEYV